MKADKTFIIAEAGVNHNGKISLAKRLIEAAKWAGADAVKFQTFRAESLVTPSAAKADYQKKHTAKNETQLAMLKKLQLSLGDHQELIKHCSKNRIMFLSTPFDEESVDVLDKLGIKYFKIPSGEITNFDLLQYIARKGKPMILSTGMSTLEEVRQAVRKIFSTGNKQLTLLHCVTDYPAPIAQLNLRAIGTLRQSFRLPVGFSDHSKGNLMAPIAVALGASVIEKHLTMDCQLPGPDHRASLEPHDFKVMVENIRLVEKALGDGQKVPAPCEVAYRLVARKSLTAIRNIVKGEKISRQDIVIKRPGSGILPGEIHKVLGRPAKNNILINETLTWAKIKK